MQNELFLSHFKHPYFVMLHDSDKKRKAKTLAQMFPSQEIEEYQKQGYGLFFTFNQFPGERKKEFCAGINAYAIDMDSKDIPIEAQKERINKCPVTPSIIVRTKNGYHLYWLVSNGKIENYERIIAKLTDYFDGDQNAKDVTRLLRVPGYNHLKDKDNPFEVDVVFPKEDTDPIVFTEEKLDSLYPEPNAQLNKTEFKNIQSLADNKKMLEFFSGKPEVNNEVYTFKKNGNDTEQILVNGETSPCWLDDKGMIGSQDRGGPTWIQWLQWYGHPKSKIAKIVKEYGLIKHKKELQRVLKTTVVEKSDGYYNEIRTADGGIKRERLTNFLMRPKNIFKELSNSEFVREFSLVSDKGYEAGPFKIYSDVMASLGEFKKFILGKGNFLYFGRDVSFVLFQEFILNSIEGFKEIFLIPRVGYLPRWKIWLFSDFAIDKEGEISYSDENGIIWLGEQGFQSYKTSVGNEDVSTESLIISENYIEHAEQLERMYIEDICKSYGNLKYKLAISWMYGNVHSEEVMKKFKIYPLLYIHGKTRSGKDVLSTWLLALFGLTHNSKESLPQMRSEVGINRKSGYYSYLPIVLDEYKNNHKISGRFDNFFKNLASKTGVTKGTRNAREIRYEPIYSNFIFTSEELPEEPAILNRSVILRVRPDERDDGMYSKINDYILDSFNIGIKWMKQREHDRVMYFKSIEKLISLLKSKGATTHTAEAYAIAGAGYYCIETNPEAIALYEKMLIEECLADNKQKEGSDRLSQFWQDMESIHADTNFNGVVVAKKNRTGDLVYLWVRFCVQRWNDFRKRLGIDNYPYSSLKALLEETPSFIDKNVPYRLNDAARRCFVFDLKKLDPEQQSFFDAYFEPPLITNSFAKF